MDGTSLCVLRRPILRLPLIVNQRILSFRETVTCWSTTLFRLYGGHCHEDGSLSTSSQRSWTTYLSPEPNSPLSASCLKTITHPTWLDSGSQPITRLSSLWKKPKLVIATSCLRSSAFPKNLNIRTLVDLIILSSHYYCTMLQMFKSWSSSIWSIQMLSVRILVLRTSKQLRRCLFTERSRFQTPLCHHKRPVKKPQLRTAPNNARPSRTSLRGWKLFACNYAGARKGKKMSTFIHWFVIAK